jgi:hypothetical protein
MMSACEIYVQSIQLEREPFESEVRAEVRRREEESRNASKRLRKGQGYMDADVVDRFTELEARSNEGAEEIRSLKEEVRQMQMAVQALQDKYMEGMQYRSSAEVVMKEQYGTSDIRAMQSSKESEENENIDDNHEKGVRNEAVDALEERGTVGIGVLELPYKIPETGEDISQGKGSGREKSTYREVLVNDKNMKQVGHRST